MKCRYCGAQMRVDDKICNFKGNYNIYWECNKCIGSCIEEIRFGQSFKERWRCENNDEVIDETIKKNIDTTKGRYYH